MGDSLAGGWRSSTRRDHVVAERRDRTSPPVSYEPRSVLVARLAQQLARDTAPRLHLAIILLLAGGTGFVSSALLLWSGAALFDNMALRYPAAALFAYLAFLLLIRAWIRLHRPSLDENGVHPLDLLDVTPDLPLPRGDSRPPDPSAFTGGRSGGGGASASWRSSDVSSNAGRGAGGDSWWDIDPGDAGWFAVLAGCAVAGLLAVGYVIYIAPLLLAEVALDAAIISALYRRLRRDEAGHWLTTVVTRTWIPALVIVVFATGVGLALTQIAPEARSVGGVIASISR